MEIAIEKTSGYCFGVEYAIQMAEQYLDKHDFLYCLGDIVHNDVEVNRLKKRGLVVIDHEKLKNIKDKKVLIRAHGEPPQTYQIALENNLKLVDASCPVVLKLQNRISTKFSESANKEVQIVILGKHGHAEVEGLIGQTEGNAIVIQDEIEIEKIDFRRPITLFSQTTKSEKTFYKIKKMIEDRMSNVVKKEVLEESSDKFKSMFKANKSICRQVSGREPTIREFSKKMDLIIFVGGKKSSNGAALFGACKEENSNSYFIENINDINQKWIRKNNKIGICGATSTPRWLMEKVQNYLLQIQF